MSTRPRARPTARARASAITSPTRWTPRRIPSAARLSTAVWLGQKSRSERQSATTRLTSSGMARLKLRRPASTWATGDVHLGCGERPGQGRVGIAVDQHPVRPLLQQHSLQPKQHFADLPAVRPRPHSQIHVRLREVQFLEEDLGHPVVVVLAGVDQKLLMPGSPHGPADWGGLDELRACPDHRGDFHEPPSPPATALASAATTASRCSGDISG